MYIPKYRAWHSSNRKIYDVTNITWQGDTILSCEIKNNDEIIIITALQIEEKEIILMPSTNQTDVNGIMLYAEDTIKSVLLKETEFENTIFTIKYGIYSAYCPADDMYIPSIGFFVEGYDFPQMPLGNTNEYAVLCDKTDKEHDE